MVLCCGPLPRRLIRRRLIISAPQPTKNCSTKLLQILTTFCTLFCRHHPMHPKTTIFVPAHIHSSCPIILLTSLTVILSHVWCIKTVTNNFFSFIFYFYFSTCIVLRSVRSFITIKWWWWWWWSVTGTSCSTLTGRKFLDTVWWELIAFILYFDKYQKLTCRRETVQCFLSLNILLSHSRLFEMTALSRVCTRRSLLLFHYNLFIFHTISEIFTSIMVWP